MRDLARGGEYLDFITDDQNNVHWGMFPSGRLVGFTGFRNLQDPQPTMRIALFAGGDIGNGFGTAASVARTFAAVELDILVNRADIHVGNVRSVWAAKRVGYLAVRELAPDGVRRIEVVQYLPGEEPSGPELGLARRKVEAAIRLGRASIRAV